MDGILLLMLSLEQLTVSAGLRPPMSFRSVGRGDNAGHFATAKIGVHLYTWKERTDGTLAWVAKKVDAISVMLGILTGQEETGVSVWVWSFAPQISGLMSTLPWAVRATTKPRQHCCK